MTTDFEAQMVSTGTKVADAMAQRVRSGMTVREAAEDTWREMVAAGMNPQGSAMMVTMVVESFVMAAEEVAA